MELDAAKMIGAGLAAIGVVGAIPSLFIVKDNFRNVPEVAVSCWPLRTPGATAPECYAIDAEVPL